jgi:hypothetical protein
MGDIALASNAVYAGPSRFISSRRHSLEIVGDRVFVDARQVTDESAKSRIRQRAERFARGDVRPTSRPLVSLGMYAGLAVEVALMICPATSLAMSVGTFWTAMGSTVLLEPARKAVAYRQAARNLQPSESGAPPLPNVKPLGVLGSFMAGMFWPAMVGAAIGNAIDKHLTLRAARKIAAEAAA